MEQIGRSAEGTVIAVFRWGIILEVGLSRVGLIDALYLDGSHEYVVGHVVTVIIDHFDEVKDKFLARPPSQIRIRDRLAHLDLGGSGF